MVRPAALSALSLALALFAGTAAFGQTAGSAPQSLSPVGVHARYSTEVPPSVDDARFQPASVQGGAPAAAPTTPVQTQAEPPQGQSTGLTPSYASQQAPQPSETITVTALRQSEDSAYRLGTGDKLRVTVFNETDLSGDFEVDGLGYVRLPLVGQIMAAGLTTYQLEDRIAEAYISGKYLINPRINVEVTTYRPFYIIGQVAKPGEYAYVNAMTAPNAIALAGGYTDEAAQTSLYIRHQGETQEVEMPADATTRIQPGDVVRVTRTGYWSVMTFLSPLLSPFGTIAYLLK